MPRTACRLPYGASCRRCRCWPPASAGSPRSSPCAPGCAGASDGKAAPLPPPAALPRAALALAPGRVCDAPLLLISGAGRGTYLGDFTVDNAAAATRYAAEITLGHMAGTTHGNAIEAANWAHAHHLHSLIIVTADYHMPRAMLEMRRALPGVRLVAAPVRPPGMGPRFSLKILRLLAGEYTKYLAVRLDLGRPAAVIVKQLD
ncbi:MAG: hypothetical protein B7Z80_15485 [Rhodospirillales bacterium 20-64-7]|nr:MAG: hypothetical protein B7Z80_15485 [Rhodospirillales bacterium 20-64-7]